MAHYLLLTPIERIDQVKKKAFYKRNAVCFRKKYNKELLILSLKTFG